MFHPMLSPSPFPNQPGPIRVVVDAAAGAVARSFDRIAAPKRNATAEFLASLAPYLSMFVNFMQTTPAASTAPLPDSDVDDIKRQLQAHEMRLNSLSDLPFGDVLNAAATDDGSGHDRGHNGTVE